MARRKVHEKFTLDSSIADAQGIVEMTGIDSVSIQAVPQTTYAGTYAVEVSIDRQRWDTAIDSAGASIAAFAAAGTKRLIPVSDVRFIRVRNSATSGSVQIDFLLYGEGEDLIAGERIITGSGAQFVQGYGTLAGGGNPGGGMIGGGVPIGEGS